MEAAMEKVERTQKVDLFVPGRLCLFGEHSDWAGRYSVINADVKPGQAIVAGIHLGIYATAQQSERFEVKSFDSEGKQVIFSCDIEYDTLRKHAASNGFFSYACGVTAYMKENYNIGGLSLQVKSTTLPIKKGLSSSAAFCVLVARSINMLYRLKLSTMGEMQAAYRGELMTGSRCGRLDQACAFGQNAVSMRFDGDDLTVHELEVGKDVYMVFADLMAKKNTLRILTDLNSAYPFARDEQSKALQQALGEDNQDILSRAETYLAQGDVPAFGRLMTEAQDIFDRKVAPMCPQELTSPVLHRFLNDPTVKALVHGGKGVGSQGDGMVQFVAKDKSSQKKLVKYLENAGLTAYAFMLMSCDRVRKAIIPVAGYGTRMYPASRFVSKALFPVIDRDGVAKPVLMYLLEEIDQAGIEEVYLIINSDDKEYYEHLLGRHLSDEHINKLPIKAQEYEHLINRIAGKVKLVVQAEQRGFGHAVYQAIQNIGNEPVLLLLGDFIYRSNLAVNCVQQTINAYYKSGGQLTVAIKPVALENVVYYGVVKGDFEKQRTYLMRVNRMIEKPTIEYAKEHLQMPGNNSESYYAVFGSYVLTPDVSVALRLDIEEKRHCGSINEVQLTDALIRVLEEKGMNGVVIDGESFDVGIPSEYLKTLKRFASE